MTPPGPDPDDASAANAKLEAIYERARTSFVAALATIDAAVSDLAAGSLDEGGRKDAERAAHRLAGGAGTVGFPEATVHARRLESAFGTAGISADEAPVLATEVTALRTILFGSRDAEE